MRFWDTSALVPLLIVEPRSAMVEGIAREDLVQAVWWGTQVEVVAAIERRHRGREISDVGRDQAERKLTRIASTWFTIEPSEGLRNDAVRVARTHGLRAGDAFQLAAALRWPGTAPAEAAFVTLDRELRQAASREGYVVLPA